VVGGLRDPGRLLLTIPHSKTDQESHGQTVIIPDIPGGAEAERARTAGRANSPRLPYFPRFKSSGKRSSSMPSW
jgi:hypothetical protein